MQLPSKNTVLFYAYGVLVAVGVALYVAWGIVYNAWNLFLAENIGIYSVVVLMVVFGVTGMLLYRSES